MTQDTSLARRAALHTALSDPGRLRIVDALSLGDAAPSELAALLRMPSNLLAHHLKVLQQAGLISRHRSEGDGRRSYLRLDAAALDLLALPAPDSGTTPRRAPRVLFVCTGNSARSQLASALWQRTSEVPAASGGTRPADRVSPAAAACAARHGLDLGEARPRHVREVRAEGDLIVTVCDRAHESLGEDTDLHWSVPAPTGAGTRAAREAVEATFAEIAERVATLTPHVRLPETSRSPA